MKNREEILEIVNKPYVGDTCVQVSVGYNESLTIFNKRGILYHDIIDYPCVPVNGYIKDDRRKYFPCLNIPTYISQKGVVETKHTMQLFNYDEVYVMIKDGEIYEKYVVRDGDNALILTKIIKSKDREIMLSRKELDSLFNRDNGNVYLMNLDGVFYTDYNTLCISSENDIVKWVKDSARNELMEYMDSDDNIISYYTLKVLENSIDNITIDNIPKETYLTEDDVVMVKIDKGNITISVFTIIFMGRDKYKVNVYDYLIDNYSLKELKELNCPIVRTKESRISYKMNLDISKDEGIRQNRLVRRRKR